MFDRVFANLEHDHIGVVVDVKEDSIVVAEGNVNNAAGIVQRKRDKLVRAYIRSPEGFSYTAQKL